MPLTNVSPSPSGTPDATDDSVVQQSTAAEDPQTDIELETRDSASHGTDQGGPGAAVLYLATLRERDPTHILFRRFTELASLSLDLEANHLEQLGHDLRQMVRAGDEGVDDFNGKFQEKLGRYYQFGCNLRAVLGFDEPNHSMFKTVMSSAKQSWGPGQGLHLNACDEDFASLFDTDKFERMMSLWPHRRLAQRFLSVFKPRTEQREDLVAMEIPGEYIQFISICVFHSCVGIFVVAPMAIQTLNVTSPTGEVVTYVVFVLVAGIAIQMFVPGFTRQLLVYLAYAGVMAAVMRQKN